MSAPLPSKAQAAVLARIRDEEVWYLATSPRRSGILRTTFDAIVNRHGWAELVGEMVSGQGKLLALTTDGRAALAQYEAK
ncbi:hypothetical protein [Nonomuraea sp. LPB2021202275-12-8]|uniref:hypothetical protein n=1 Tax=Nonomuraea sp. LPB2021202275-12-8 TaxID=3120159 RepID=UPI00300CBB32